MATDHLQIPSIQASQNQKEVTANAADNLLDRAMNQRVPKVITGSTSFTATETRQNAVVELTGTPGAPFTVDMPDTNQRKILVLNSTDAQATIRNSLGAGTNQPVLEVGGIALFHYDGTNFIVFTSSTVSDFISLTDTPASYAGQAGKAPIVNAGETGLIFGSITASGAGGDAFALRGARVRMSAPQSVPAGGAILGFDQELFDTDGLHDTVTNNSRLTVPAGVTHARLTAGVTWVAHAGTFSRVEIFKNGAQFSGGAAHKHPDAEGNAVTLDTGPVVVAPGDFFEVRVDHDAGVGVNFGGDNLTWFALEVADAKLPQAPARGALARKSANQTLTTATPAVLTFDVDVHDVGSVHDTVTNNSRFVVPSGVSKIRMKAQVAFAANATGTRVVEVLKNGAVLAPVVFEREANQGGTNAAYVHIDTGMIEVAAGDFMEVRATQDSGGNLDVLGVQETWAVLEVAEGPALLNVGAAEAFLGALAKSAANQSIPNNAFTIVTFGTTVKDTSGFHNSAVGNSKLTIPTGVSRIRLYASTQFAPNATGERAIRLTKNGSALDPLVQDNVEPEAANNQSMNLVSYAIDVVAGDFFEVEVFQNSGAALNVLSASNNTWFAIEVLDSGVVPSLPEGAHASHSVAQSITVSGTWQALALDSEAFDDKTLHDTVTNNSRITVPGGVTHLRLTARVDFAANATGVRGARITKNGSPFAEGPSIVVPSAGGTDETKLTVVTGLLPVQRGDFFEVEALQTSGGALNAQSTSWFNAEVVTGIAPPAFRGALVSKTANQSISSDVNTAVTWNAETYDTDAIHDNVTNNTRLTVPAGVRKVKVGTGIRFGNSSTGRRYVFVNKNGASFPGFPSVREDAHENSEKTLWSPVLEVTPGDYFEAIVNQNSGVAQNVETADTTWFAMEIVD